MAEVTSQDGSTALKDAAEGEEGEMWVRGPTIVKVRIIPIATILSHRGLMNGNLQGYLNNDEANASSFTQDGWYKTGDVLKRDADGYFYVVDRKKEMIKYKGNQGTR